MRFHAPHRDAVPSSVFDHAAFASLQGHRDLLTRASWPEVDALNERMPERRHALSGVPLRFVAQSRALLADGLHYETRIHQRGEIATRTDNWHDLLNALIWIEHTALKSALNARQAADVARAGAKSRTRAQCALTHFDEAGAVVHLGDPGLLRAWDAHDWRALFLDARGAWLQGAGARVLVFGHALLEHLLRPSQLVAAKCLVVLAAPGTPGDGLHAQATVADAIAQGSVLRDPQELRPLPLSGIPGWLPGAQQDEAFYRDAPCFRPLRPGRAYPAPLRAPLVSSSSQRLNASAAGDSERCRGQAR